MKVAGGAGHLTYCTNIHPGESWPEVRDTLRLRVTAVKDRISPDRPFGVGLRLSARAAEALRDEAAFAELRDLLAAADLYVFTINGFPYGPFHRTRVKEEVYLPDWRDEARLGYTNLLADLLAALLPDEEGLDGSVSTVPGAFKPNAATPEAVARMAALMVDHAAHLVTLRERSGRTIALALEPEPCCFLETIEETAAFFEGHLFSAAAVDRLGKATGLAPAAAEAALRRHLGVCYDLCHGAVEFEDPIESLERLRGAGIGIYKVQLSAGLCIADVVPEAIEPLRQFDDAVYLHQVVERSENGLARFVDLPEAFAALAQSRGAREWRVHFHVPIFREDLGAFTTTQSFIETMLALHRQTPIAPHLEVETYTWDVLPERFRGEEVDAAVARELAWVLDRLS
jgi:sugar phosphate isomerase/epimerase